MRMSEMIVPPSHDAAVVAAGAGRFAAVAATGAGLFAADGAGRFEPVLGSIYILIAIHKVCPSPCPTTQELTRGQDVHDPNWCICEPTARFNSAFAFCARWPAGIGGTRSAESESSTLIVVSGGGIGGPGTCKAKAHKYT
jgi:hypothetical protein